MRKTPSRSLPAIWQYIQDHDLRLAVLTAAQCPRNRWPHHVVCFFKLQFVVKLPIRSTDWALPSDNPLKWWLIWQRLWQGRMHHRLSKSKFVKRSDLNGQFMRNMLFNCSETKATPVFVCKGMWSVAPKASNHVGKEGEISLPVCPKVPNNFAETYTNLSRRVKFTTINSIVCAKGTNKMTRSRTYLLIGVKRLFTVSAKTTCSN